VISPRIFMGKPRLRGCPPVIPTYKSCSMRSWDEQDELYRLGKSEKKGGESKHNFTLEDGVPYSKAVDSAIWHPERPHIHWQDEKSAIYFAGIIKGAADALHIPVRVGTDWNMNLDVTDDWQDCWHTELLT